MTDKIVTRVARILVEVYDDWLNGDYPEEVEKSIEEGWRNIAGHLPMLPGFFDADATFIEWEPDEKELEAQERELARRETAMKAVPRDTFKALIVKYGKSYTEEPGVGLGSENKEQS